MNAVKITCNTHNLDILRDRHIVKNTTRKISRLREQKHVESPTVHKADAFMHKSDIDEILYDLFSRKQFVKATLLIFGFNTGYRCGDILSFRVCDLIQDGRCVSQLNIEEQKTGKVRTVYLNKTVKLAIEFLVAKMNLSESNYLFCSEGNRRSYLDEFVYNEYNEVIDIKTTGEKYLPNGEERERTPMMIGSVSRWLKNTTANLNIQGHYSSHCMRKTFAEHLSRDWNDNRNVNAACVALAHSSIRTTIDHYMGIDPVKLKQTWNNLNLGLEVLELFVDEEKEIN